MSNNNTRSLYQSIITVIEVSGDFYEIKTLICKPNLKMAVCGVCNKGLGNRIKVSCSDCEKDFHGGCVKMTKADIDYLENENLLWRCDPCSITRRSSLRLETQATEGSLSLQDIMKAIEELKGEQKETLRDINNSYEVLNNKLDDNTGAIQQNTEKLNEYIGLINALKEENAQLKGKVSDLESRIDEMEQYSRKNCIEIHGVPANDSNVIDKVKDVGKALGMDISDQMIDNCHLLGRKKDSDRPPGIIVKFVRKIDAEDMMRRKKEKKLSTRHLGLQTDTPIYINESLSPARRRLFAMAREVKAKKQYKWLWARSGKIFLRKEDKGPVSIIKSQADLANL